MFERFNKRANVTFYEKVMELKNNYIRKIGIEPNELRLGYFEEAELDKYIEQNAFLSLEIDSYQLKKINNRKIEFAGFKVIFEDKDSVFEVRYNPHYD